MAIEVDPNEPVNEPTTPEGETGTAIEKFKTAEDRDRAYVELERRATQDAQEKAELKRRLEDLESSQYRTQRPAQDQREFTDVYKSQEETKKFWERFADKPTEVLGEVVQRSLNLFEQRQAQRDTAREAIEGFKNKYPELAPYEDIVTAYVLKQPSNLHPRERLERAAPEVRKVIARIAGNKNPSKDSSFDAETFVESPSQNRGGSEPRETKPAKPEDALAEYMKEQETYMAKRAVPPRLSK